MDTTQRITDKDFLQNGINLFAQRKYIQGNIDQNLETFNNNYMFLEQKVKIRYSACSILCFIFTVFALFSSVVMYILFKAMFGSDFRILQYQDVKLFYNNYELYNYVYFINLIITSILTLLSTISICRNRMKVRKINKSKVSVEQKNKVLSSIIYNDYDKLQQIEKMISELDILHPTLWYAGDYILQYIMIGRASTVMEAINLFEQERLINMQLNLQLQQMHKFDEMSNKICSYLGSMNKKLRNLELIGLANLRKKYVVHIR